MRTTVNLDKEQVERAKEYASREKIAVSRAINHYVKLGQNREDLENKIASLEDRLLEQGEQINYIYNTIKQRQEG